jgi:hypothetical protein
MKRRFTRLFDPNKRDVYEESSTLLRTSRSQDLFEVDIASGISLAVMSGLDNSKIRPHQTVHSHPTSTTFMIMSPMVKTLQ